MKWSGRPATGRRISGIALLIVAAFVLLISLSMPFCGATLLALFRGREIHAAAALALLPRLLLLYGILGIGSSAMLASAGALLMIGHSADPEYSQPKAAFPPQVEPGKAAWWIIGAITLLLAGFVWVGIPAAGRSFTYDEILEMTRDMKPFRPRGMENHYGGAALARAAIALFGLSERAARAGSLALTVVGIALASWAGWKWGRHWFGAIFPALYLTMNGFVLTYATQIRGYAVMMWSALGVAVLLALDSDDAVGPSARALKGALLFAAAVLLGLSHMFGLVFLASFAFVLHVIVWKGLAFGRRGGASQGRVVDSLTRDAVLLALGAVLSLLAWAPTLPWLFYYRARTTVDVAGVLLKEIPFLTLGRLGLPVGGLLFFVVFMLASSIAARTFFPLRIPGLISAFVPLGLCVAAFAYRPRFLEIRFFSAALPLWVLCAAATGGALLAGGRTRDIAGLLVLALTALLLIPGRVSLLHDSRGYREQARDIVSKIEARNDSRARLVLPSNVETADVISYYLPGNLVLRGLDEREWRRRTREGIPDFVVALGEPEDLSPAWRAGLVRRALAPVTSGDTSMTLWSSP